MATINDVCKLAGVSKATVSRVINGSPQVKEQTRELVHSAMKSLGYQPNVLAQALATNTANSIGFVLPHFDSNYFGSALRQAAQKVQKANKKLFVMDSHNHLQGEIEAVRTLANQRCDSIVLYSRHLSEEQLIELQQQIKPPIIVLNRTLSEGLLYSFGFAQQQLADLAMDHLLSLGHTQIACITTPLNSETGKRRLASYKNKLTKAGIEVNPSLIIEGESNLSSGYAAGIELLKRGVSFTAIFACNDDMGLGAIRSLHERGIKVPDDISVIGIDNEPAATYSIPSLSSVAIPIEQLTIDAIDLAIRIVAHNENTPKYFEYLGELLPRESSRQR
jgi:LacI family transcriptional regulator